MQRSCFISGCHIIVVIVCLHKRELSCIHATFPLCTNTKDDFLFERRDAVLARISPTYSARNVSSFRFHVVCCMRNIFCQSICFAFDWSPNEYNIYKIVVYNAIGM